MLKLLKKSKELLRDFREDFTDLFNTLSPEEQYQLQAEWRTLPHSIATSIEVEAFNKCLLQIIRRYPTIHDNIVPEMLKQDGPSRAWDDLEPDDINATDPEFIPLISNDVVREKEWIAQQIDKSVKPSSH
ncbi:MAG: hypothetical protein EOO61_07765 [Hymenobacter sp.]|nr:MAG: hypothetical protein EOO61_07765 [Hymenobacter sp.]